MWNKLQITQNQRYINKENHDEGTAVMAHTYNVNQTFQPSWDGLQEGTEKESLF